MVNPSILIAVAVTALVALAEFRHAQRIRRVERLAFGTLGRAARWTVAVPFLRCLGAGLAIWGLLFLAQYDPVEIDARPARNASKHLLILLDASPSMMIKDAGPDQEKVSRGAWAGKVAQGVIDRLDMDTTRITIVAFYTDALPVVKETFDKEVVRNALDGLPMYAAFEPGATNLGKGLAEAAEIARPWPRRSATLLILSDGDANDAAPPSNMPSSIADTIVVGVGDPVKPTVVHGHSSRQEAMSLRQLALRVRGYYHEGNRKHLPSDVLAKLTMIAPRVADRWSARDVAILATGTGAFALALAGPSLMLFGRSRSFVRDRQEVTRRARSENRPTTDAGPRQVEQTAAAKGRS